MPYFTVILGCKRDWGAELVNEVSHSGFGKSLLRMSWHSKDRKSSWAIPPIKFQSYRWLLRCSAVHAPRDISRFTFFSSPKVIGCYFILSFSHFILNWVDVRWPTITYISQVKPLGRREGRKPRWSEEQQSKDWISVYFRADRPLLERDRFLSSTSSYKILAGRKQCWSSKLATFVVCKFIGRVSVIVYNWRSSWSFS